MLNVVEDKDTTSGNLKGSGYCSKLIVNKKKRETAKRKGPKQYEEGDIEEFETMQQRPVSNIWLESYNKSKKGSMLDNANVVQYAQHLKTASNTNLMSHRGGGSPRNHQAIQKKYLEELEELNELNDSDLYSEEEDSASKASVSVSDSMGSDSEDEDEGSDKSMEDIDDDDLMDLNSDNAKQKKPPQTKKKEKVVPLYQQLKAQMMKEDRKPEVSKVREESPEDSEERQVVIINNRSFHFLGNRF